MELLLHPHGLAVLATFPDFLHLSGVPSHKLTQFTLNNRYVVCIQDYSRVACKIWDPYRCLDHLIAKKVPKSYFKGFQDQGGPGWSRIPRAPLDHLDYYGESCRTLCPSYPPLIYSYYF